MLTKFSKYFTLYYVRFFSMHTYTYTLNAWSRQYTWWKLHKLNWKESWYKTWFATVTSWNIFEECQIFSHKLQLFQSLRAFEQKRWRFPRAKNLRWIGLSHSLLNFDLSVASMRQNIVTAARNRARNNNAPNEPKKGIWKFVELTLCKKECVLLFDKVKWMPI